MQRRIAKIGIHVVGTGSGGIWRYVHSILRGINFEEFAVSLFCDIEGGYTPRPEVSVVNLDRPPTETSLRPAEGRSANAAVPRGSSRTARLFPIPTALRLWAGFARDAYRLSRTFRGHDLDLLHTTQTGCEEAPPAARLAGIPRVLGTFHIDPSYDLAKKRSGTRYRVLEHLSNHCLTRAIGVSNDTCRSWIQRTHLSPHRVVKIYNAIDTITFRRRACRATARRALNLTPTGLLVGAVGRLEDAKGFTYLIDALALLVGDFPELDLVIAGDGPLRAALETRARSLGVLERVRFLGFRADVSTVYDAIDVLAAPSLCEAFGYMLLEGMAAEVPVVATRVGGIPEVVADGKTGLLVEPADSVALAMGLRALLDSPDQRLRMGANGRARVERCFSEDEMVRNTITVYRTMLRALT